MTPAQEGAYIRLLAYCWDSGDCSLPDDDTELAILSRLGEGWFNGGSTVLRRCFIQHPTKPGFLTNQKLIDEAEKQAAWRAKSAAGGRKSAAQRAESKATSKGGSTVVQPKLNISSASATAVKDEGDDRREDAATLFQRVYDYGCSLFPQLAPQNNSVIHQWITAGADVELDILPEIRRIHGKGVNPRGWGLFTQDIANAKARRESPLPKGNAHEYRSDRSGTSKTKFQLAVEATERARAAREQGGPDPT
jgi:uncharacterized protein YdaU (DUF1376 family)